MRIRFLTATPLDVTGGSGTYVGMSVLSRALVKQGHVVVFQTPARPWRIYTAGRLWFNSTLRPAPDFDLTVGFDMDGYRIASGPKHVAALKGVIADELRFESGFTHWTMSMQARRERIHVHRAARVLVTSRYSRDRAMEFYGLTTPPSIVPELIDLAEWRAILAKYPAPQQNRDSFTVLYVGRFYRRKRVDVLLRAASMLRTRLPELRVRIVGNGPCNAQWRALARELKLDSTVEWLGDVARSQLAAEYNRADAFCLPSVQEGFGIVLLEAMAAGRPIVAARAGAVPEVAPHTIFAEPDDAESLASALEQAARSPSERMRICAEGLRLVEQYDAPIVAGQFVEAALNGR